VNKATSPQWSGSGQSV